MNMDWVPRAEHVEAVEAAKRAERERVLAAFSSYEVQLRSMGVALAEDGLPTRDIDTQLEALRVLREALRHD